METCAFCVLGLTFDIMTYMTENQNTKKTVYGVIVVIIIIVVMSILLGFFNKPDGTAQRDPYYREYTPNLPQPLLLHNEAYGFEITAPAGITPEGTFKKQFNLSDKWRVNASESGAGSKGTALLAIPLVQIDNKDIEPKVYPLYFDAEVRVGVSSSTVDCLKKDAGYANQKVADVTINGVAFKKFSFGDAAMMKYVQGESYRAVHNGLCFAIEQIKSGSTYHEPNAEEALTNEDMDVYYAQAAEVVQSFKFTK